MNWPRCIRARSSFVASNRRHQAWRGDFRMVMSPTLRWPPKSSIYAPKTGFCAPRGSSSHHPPGERGFNGEMTHGRVRRRSRSPPRHSVKETSSMCLGSSSHSEPAARRPKQRHCGKRRRREIAVTEKNCSATPAAHHRIDGMYPRRIGYPGFRRQSSRSGHLRIRCDRHTACGTAGTSTGHATPSP